ncbi:hypothetical protein PL79_015360 [Burkholderia sp. USMB20]|nr:hypothetical protein PL79_015360 [Burkholderia sp. USMB20]
MIVFGRTKVKARTRHFDGALRRRVGGRRKAEGGRRKAEGGRRKADGARRKAQGASVRRDSMRRVRRAASGLAAPAGCLGAVGTRRACAADGAAPQRYGDMPAIPAAPAHSAARARTRVAARRGGAGPHVVVTRGREACVTAWCARARARGTARRRASCADTARRSCRRCPA